MLFTYNFFIFVLFCVWVKTKLILFMFLYFIFRVKSRIYFEIQMHCCLPPSNFHVGKQLQFLFIGWHISSCRKLNGFSPIKWKPKTAHRQNAAQCQPLVQHFKMYNNPNSLLDFFFFYVHPYSRTARTNVGVVRTAHECPLTLLFAHHKITHRPRLIYTPALRKVNTHELDVSSLRVRACPLLNWWPFYLKFLWKSFFFTRWMASAGWLHFFHFSRRNSGKRKVLGSVMYPSSNAVRMTPPPTHGREYKYFLSFLPIRRSNRKKEWMQPTEKIRSQKF